MTKILYQPTAVSFRKRGFTLTELAIVLAILGLLLVGLFQLTSASSRQLNSQILAQQLQNYSKTAKSYLLVAKRPTGAVQDDGTFVLYANGQPTGATIPTAAGNAYDITGSVQGFANGALPATTPNGGQFKVFMYRNPIDIGSKASFVIVVTATGAFAPVFTLQQLGNIATYVGAEGATISNGPSACLGALNINGAYGGTCFDAAPFNGLGIANNTPAALSFYNMFSSGVTDSNYLWRVNPGPGNGDLNKMTVDLGMGGIGLAPNNPTAFHDIVFYDAGNIAMNGGAITGVSGGIDTGGGSINTVGGTIDLGNSDVTQIHALTFYTAIGTAPRVEVGTDADTGATTLNVNNTDIRMAGTLRASNLLADSFIYTSSDIRLKDNIKDLAKPLDTLLRIKGVSYRLKSANQQTDGVLAQDVEKVYPELVKTDDNGYKRVNYNGLIGPLIESIRELKQRNDALQARVDALEAGLRQ